MDRQHLLDKSSFNFTCNDNIFQIKVLVKRWFFLMDRQHFLDKSSFDFTGNDQEEEKVHVADTTTDELDKRHFVRPEQRIEN